MGNLQCVSNQDEKGVLVIVNAIYVEQKFPDTPSAKKEIKFLAGTWKKKKTQNVF